MSGIDTLAERLAQVDADTLFDELAARLERIVPFDASRFFGTDPSTLIATFPARIDGVANNQCHAYWQREFLVEDADLFRDLARAPAFARPSMGSRRARSPSPRRSSVGWPRTLTREPTKRCSCRARQTSCRSICWRTPSSDATPASRPPRERRPTPAKRRSHG